MAEAIKSSDRKELATEKTAFHVSNFGSFGGNIPTDIDGYCYLTAEEWINDANMDAMTELDEESAEELADLAVETVNEAREAVAEWQAS